LWTSSPTQKMGVEEAEDMAGLLSVWPEATGGSGVTSATGR
jgi:hypothetical protein